MPRDLLDGETCEMQGSGKMPYILKNVGGVYSCSCPAWRNQPHPINVRTCKHLKKLRGDEIEFARINAATSSPNALALALSSSKSKDNTKAPPLLLAEKWNGVLDPTGWWWSEKLDGVRAFWKDGKFLSKLGNTFLAPSWFTRGMPDQPLDGELWAGRGKFQRASSIVRRYDAGDLWGELKFVVFDGPALGGPFESRQQRLFSLAQGSPYISIVEQSPVKSLQHLKDELAKAESFGAEGLMIRKPGSFYEIGKSSTLLKVKSFLDDEATVTGYQKGKGKYKDGVGALEVKWNDKEFEIGTGLSDADRVTPPNIGDIIKFKYTGLTDGGIPRHAVFLGLRED